ncbi:MAG: insulinase family protein, partial [Thermoleophilia bacterium]|nr:insulinase family protein [Thermoleophilia bacterium]
MGRSRGAAPAPAIRVQNMKSHRLTTFPGGERVITERIDGVRSAAIGLWIGAGSRDEPLAKAGASHFIEHLLFKGTERYDAVKIAELFDTMGGELNAATSRETTVVYTRVPDDHLDVALDVMTDMVFSPALTDLDSEREVVLEEIAMVDDNPQDLVHDLAAEAVFGDHPLGRPVIGRAEVISSISRRSLLGYHRSAYRGPNVVLAAAGNVDHKCIVAALRKSRKGAGGPAPALPRKPAGRIAAPGARFL